MRHRLRVAASVAVLTTSFFGGFVGSTAHADDTRERDSRSLDLFEKSEAAYDKGRFAEAITLLQQAYALKKEPVLFYNMGRAYEGMGELLFAAKAYEGFLQGQPNASDRGALERRILTLRQQHAEREALRQQALERERTPPAPRTFGPSASAAPWIIVGIGGAGLAAGGVFGLMASQRNLDAKNEPTYARADTLHAQAESFAKVANVCFIAGGVVLVTGIIWGILDVSATKRAQPRAGEPLPLGTFTF